MDEQLKEIHEICIKAGSWPMCWPDTALKEPDRCRSVASQLVALLNKYNAGDSLALPEVVNLTWREAFEIPRWAHKALAAAFFNFMEHEGEIRLDILLNLHKGKGRDNDPFKRRDRKGLNAEIVLHIGILNECLNFSLPVTYQILSRMKILYGDGNKYISTVLSSSRIEEIYKVEKGLFLKEDFFAVCGHTPEDRLDFFMTDYAEYFERLYEDGTFHNEGLLSSAMRSFHALFPRVEPLSVPSEEKSGGQLA